MSTLRDQVIAKAKGQTGVRYWSMHTGPKGSSEEGFGCAMLCAWCYNQVLGTNLYGSCWSFAGECLGQSVNQGGTGSWEFVSESEAVPGDCILYINAGYDGTDYDDYGHMAMYLGNGRVIGALGHGTPGSSDYLNIGVKETAISGQSLGGGYRFIRCTRLDDSPQKYDIIPVKMTVTVYEGGNVRDAPSKTTGNVVTRYDSGEKVNLDGIVFNDSRVWGHYIGGTSGKDRYIALGLLEFAR